MNNLHTGDLKNKLIEHRYLIQNEIGKGQFGKVFDCSDLVGQYKNLVIKVSKHVSNSLRE